MKRTLTVLARLAPSAFQSPPADREKRATGRGAPVRSGWFHLLASGTWRVYCVAAVFLTALAVAAPAHADPTFWFTKLENQGRYIQIAHHGPITITGTHQPAPPNQYWNTPVNFGETAGAGGDNLQITGSSQHIVPVCTGEAPKGGVFPYSLTFSSPPLGVTQKLAAGHTLHPGPPNHKDMFIAVAAVGSVTAGQIQNYIYLSIGRHDPPGCQAAEGMLTPDTPEPGPGPGPGPPYGSTALIYDELDDSIAMGIAVPGIDLAGLQEAYIGRISDGQVILDLLDPVAVPEAEWHDADGLGVAGFIDGAIFPDLYVPDLLGDNTFLRIVHDSLPGPSFAISGDLRITEAPLIPEPATWLLLSVGALALLARSAWRRRRAG